MTNAPSIFANCSAKRETPPVPCTKTVSPAFTPAFRDQRPPCGHPCRRQRCGLFIAQVRRRDNDVVLRQNHELRHGPVQLDTQSERKSLFVRIAGQPALQHQGADAITFLQIRHAFTDLVDHAHAVAEHDQRELLHTRAVAALRHEKRSLQFSADTFILSRTWPGRVAGRAFLPAARSPATSCPLPGKLSYRHLEPSPSWGKSAPE
jgi:hypothetical protein